MPVAPTYPGVYIEEISSGVHTITGVGTSITAFVGYTARGMVDEPIHIFSYADFERGFGGLSADSPLSYCVKHFFQNGGTEAYVVRIAHGAASASVTLRNVAGAVLEITAASAGTWGNNLQIDVDYDTLNPSSLFNLKVTEFVDKGGQMVPGRIEIYRNLSLNSFDSSYAVSIVNASSDLITVVRSAGLVFGSGTSVTGAISAADLALVTPSSNQLGFVLNGQIQGLITLTTPASIASIAANIVGGVLGLGGVVTQATTASTITITATPAGERSSIHFYNAPNNNSASILKFGVANGGTEVDAGAAVRPLPTGTLGVATLPATANGALTIDVKRGAVVASLVTINVPVWGAGTTRPQPLSLDEVASQITDAMNGLASTQPFLVGATAQRIGSTIRVLPGSADPNISFDVSGATAATLGLTAANARNVARYAPGVGLTALAQVQGTAGNNGTPPNATELIGSEAAKTGIYGLENVDLFNLLVMPDATAGSALLNVLTEAIAYCTRRRAFMIIDAPDTIDSFAKAQTWMGSTASPLRSRNSAIYFPRMREPDPLMNGVVHSIASAGALAGLYARTDAERGVWKAPAGTSATIVGATGLAYTLTDKENGTLNPLGLNCLRTFPVYGTVSWGARTGNGADALADEYKYIPVRRLALYLEESLYRGTQWAVFEPNDEPLWAQIRLNLGAFMHTLFAQGAFQGRTPRDAYFVKCDKETTTQNDIDLGRVNIVVGFAPLKPAEFVIIQIQQIAGAIQT